jgi:hypothetical protein
LIFQIKKNFSNLKFPHPRYLYNTSHGFAFQSCKKTHGFVMIFATSTMLGDLAKMHAKTFENPKNS